MRALYVTVEYALLSRINLKFINRSLWVLFSQDASPRQLARKLARERYLAASYDNALAYHESQIGGLR